jgi:hypothetical protein
MYFGNFYPGFARSAENILLGGMNGYSDPAFCWAYYGDAEIALVAPIRGYGHKDVFRFTDDAHFFGVHACNEQGCAVPEYMIVAGALACVNKK